MDLSTLFEWLKEQAGYVLMIIGIIIILVTAAQRRWTAMIGAIIAIAFIAFQDPFFSVFSKVCGTLWPTAAVMPPVIFKDHVSRIRSLAHCCID